MRAAVAALHALEPAGGGEHGGDGVRREAGHRRRPTGGGGRRGGGPGAGGGAGAPGGGAPPPPNFAGLNGSLIRQLDTLDFGDMAPNEPMMKVWGAGCADLRTAVMNWHAINAKDLPAFNAVLTKNSLKAIPVATPALAVPVCAPAPIATPTLAGARGGGYPNR